MPVGKVVGGSIRGLHVVHNRDLPAQTPWSVNKRERFISWLSALSKGIILLHSITVLYCTVCTILFLYSGYTQDVLRTLHSHAPIRFYASTTIQYPRLTTLIPATALPGRYDYYCTVLDHWELGSSTPSTSSPVWTLEDNLHVQLHSSLGR